MNLRRLAVALVLASSALRVHAFTIEYAVDRPVPLVKCDQLRYRGSRNDAQTCYRALVADSKDTRIRADAARASGDARGDHARGYAAQHDANRVDAPLDRPREDRVLGRQQLGRELE